MTTHWSRYAFAAVCALVGTAPALAQNYPARPVTLITSTPAGNGPDVIARLVADGLSRLWKQQVIVDNRPGGRAVVATLAAKNAAPDGYTLYVALGSTFVILPEIQSKLPFDLDRDLTPIGVVGAQPFAIVVNPTLGVNTLGELIARSRNRPGEILYGCFRGSAPHLAFERMQAGLGGKMTLVPYTGTARVVSDLLGGTISVAIESLPAMTGAISAGKIKALAVTSATRLPEYPDVPAVAESLPGYEATGWFVLMAPAGTPPSIVDKINADLRTVLESAGIRKKFAALGTYPMIRTPAEVTQFIKAQQADWKPVVHSIGLATH